MPSPATRARPWDPGGLRQVEIAGGNAWCRTTIGVLARMVREQHTDPQIRRRAVQLLSQYEPGVDGLDVIRAVWELVTSELRYVRDPLGVEWLTDPIELDTEIDEGWAAEDCESLVGYAATLLAALGIRSRFEAQAKDPAKRDLLSHLALVVRVPQGGGWISFDPTGRHYFPGFSLGDSLLEPQEHVEYFDSLTGARVDDAERQPPMSWLGDALGDAMPPQQQQRQPSGVDIANVILGTAQAALPYAGPYGSLVAGLLQVGTSIVDAKTGLRIGLPPAGGPQQVAGPPPGSTPVPSAGGGKKGRKGGDYAPPGGPDDGGDSSTIKTVAGVGLALALAKAVL